MWKTDKLSYVDVDQLYVVQLLDDYSGQDCVDVDKVGQLLTHLEDLNQLWFDVDD